MLFFVGPAWKTAGQHRANISSMSQTGWARFAPEQLGTPVKMIL